VTASLTIIVHGGAGERAATSAASAAARQGCERAAQAGYALLRAGGTALDAVEAAVKLLEDDEQFNAGRGACLTREGTVELDAAIMSGTGLRAGAVGALAGVKNPIALARRVLEDGEHVLLVGAGALAFARQVGVELVAPDHHITEARRQSLAAALAARRGGEPPSSGGGTVGAVAIDSQQRIAAATSTGGTVAKRPGRVGDSPLPGSGTYADDEAGGASATGEGERIIKLVLAKAAIDRLSMGQDPTAAATAVIAELGGRLEGRGGIILIDRHGQPGFARNTPSMPCATIKDGTLTSAL
jgi:beta-aspartyl-peptidase (threonine type)